MNCPACNDGKVVILHTDEFECTECKSKVEIKYCLCRGCGGAFRTNNEIFLDDAFVMSDPETSQILGEIFEGLAAEMGEVVKEIKTHDDAREDIMSNLIHKCIRCGDLSVYKNGNDFKCSACGFEWEILKDE